MTGTVGETVDGGRTVDALGLGRRRVERVDADLADAYRAERRTLYLRTVLFPTVEIAYVLPVAVALVLGRLARLRRPRLDRRGDDGRALRAAARRPGRPADLLARRDPGRCDVVRAARRRHHVPTTATATGEEPEHERLRAYGRPLRLRRRTATSSTASTSISRPASGSPSSGRPARASRRSVGCSPGSIRRAPAASRSATSGSST